MNNYKKNQIPVVWESDPRIQLLKQEFFDSWKDRLPESIPTKEKGRGNMQIIDNVIRVKSFPEITPQGKIELIKEFDFTHNIVTNDGDAYYARQGANETHAANEDFGDQAGGATNFEMGTTAFTTLKASDFGDWDVGAASKISGSRVNYTATYPKTNDTGDADNTGDAIDAVSYAINYTATSWNDTTVETGCIHENDTPGTTTKLLTGWSFTQFAKTTSDTLKVFVNHTMLGV